MVLFVLLATILIGVVLGIVFNFGLSKLWGYDLQNLTNGSITEMGASGRNKTRVLLLINHFFTFSFGPLLTAYFFYRKDWSSYLGLTQTPKPKAGLMTFLLILACMPLMQLTYYLNQQIPLPEWMAIAEESSNALISAMLQMETPLELVLNLFAIAVLPAVGEELLFRGVLQREMQKLTANGHWAVWISAFLFSAIHFQFAGFLPRFLLGAGLGYLLYWTNNLWLPILGHFIFNGMQVFAVFVTGDVAMGEDMPAQEELEKALPVLMVLGVGAIAVVYYVARFFTREKEMVDIERN